VVQGSLSGLSCKTCVHKDCDGRQGISRFSMDGEDIDYCPLSVATPEISRYFSFYTHYKNGYLPASGGVLDQTARFLRMMEIIQSAVTDYEQEETKRRNR
jgi:hypothetical protein